MKVTPTEKKEKKKKKNGAGAQLTSGLARQSHIISKRMENTNTGQRPISLFNSANNWKMGKASISQKSSNLSKEVTYFGMKV